MKKVAVIIGCVYETQAGIERACAIFNFPCGCRNGLKYRLFDLANHKNQWAPLLKDIVIGSWYSFSPRMWHLRFALEIMLSYIKVGDFWIFFLEKKVSLGLWLCHLWWLSRCRSASLSLLLEDGSLQCSCVILQVTRASFSESISDVNLAFCNV